MVTFTGEIDTRSAGQKRISVKGGLDATALLLHFKLIRWPTFTRCPVHAATGSTQVKDAFWANVTTARRRQYFSGPGSFNRIGPTLDASHRIQGRHDSRKTEVFMPGNRQERSP